MTDHKVWATINVAVMKNGKVLLSRRSKKKWMSGYLVLPGGHVVPDEAPSVAAAREIHEELGLDLSVERYEFLCVYVRFSEDSIEREKVAYEFAVHLTDDEDPINTEPDLCTELVWADPSRLPGKVVPEFEQVINKALLGGQKYLEIGY